MQVASSLSHNSFQSIHFACFGINKCSWLPSTLLFLFSPCCETVWKKITPPELIFSYLTMLTASLVFCFNYFVSSCFFTELWWLRKDILSFREEDLTFTFGIFICHHHGMLSMTENLKIYNLYFLTKYMVSQKNRDSWQNAYNRHWNLEGV